MDVVEIEDDANQKSSNKKTKPSKRRRCMIYPDNPRLQTWDIFMIFILVLACLITPYRLAFIKNDSDDSVFNVAFVYLIDILFLVDIIIIFNTAYQDEFFKLITNRKVIAKNYLTGWFTIDLVAIIPFNLILQATTNMNQIIRFARIGKLYKLVKLTKLIRIFKIVKSKGRFMDVFTNLLKIGPGFERFFFFLLISMILTHITSCMWILLP